MTERLARVLEEFLHIARGDAFLAHHHLAAKIMLAEMHLDQLADAIEDVHLRAGGATQHADRRLICEARREKFGQRQFDRTQPVSAQLIDKSATELSMAPNTWPMPTPPEK